MQTALVDAMLMFLVTINWRYLDISDPNDIVLMLSTYYAEVARMIDIKVTKDNNWVLVNHELNK